MFVGGLHRSGTTPLSRWLATHPGVSGLEGTGVFEDEGQHLQSVYPVALAHGGPGRFALDPAARLTEQSSLVTADASRRLVEAWAPYWDTDKAALVEKSPPNLVRIRFLRALFPEASFIVIVRHPIAVSVATSKWAGADMDALFRNWVAGHEHLVDDADHAGRVTLVRYEDLMTDPEREMARVFAFLGLPPADGSWSVKAGINERYFTEFRSEWRPWRKWGRASLIERYTQAAARFGYSLTEPEMLGPPAPEVAELMGSPSPA